MKKNLDNFVDNPSFQNQDYNKIWQDIKNLPSFANKKINIQNKEDKSANNSKLPFYKDSLGNSICYLPLEFMKEDQEDWFHKEIKKTFLSSGTSGSSRSKSHFSQDGLLLYKLASLKTFHDLLQNFFPKKELINRQGISLIPDTNLWPDSSLAQMIEWFSQFWSVNYISKPEKIKIDRNEPVWLFATAVQLMDIHEKGLKIPLPKKSLVIETGGTKTRTKVFSKKELYKAIEEIFSVPQEQIISEYSMCELSSQAYDFVDKTATPKKRCYRFPFWVDHSVLHPLSQERQEGFGALVIKDPLRVDYPYPMRTQDLCELSKDQSFTLMGRVPKATLKGCSLKAEELLNHNPLSLSIKSTQEKQDPSLNLTTSKITQVKKHLENFFSQKDTLETLEKEYFSPYLAKTSINDLLQGFPDSIEAWKNLIKISQAKKGDHCFIILPNNHTFVLFYPFIVAYFSQLKLSIRLPQSYASGSLLHKFLDSFQKKFDYSVEILETNFRFSKTSTFKPEQKVLAYGSTETETLFKKEVNCPQNFFGGGISLSIIEDLGIETLELALKDAFSLGQTGCFSSRAIFCLQETSSEKRLRDKLEKISRNFLQISLSAKQSIALDQELLQLKKPLFNESSLRKNNSPLFPFYKIPEEKKMTLEEIISPCPYVLPFIFCSIQTFLQLINSTPSLIKISLPDELNTKIWTTPELKKIHLCSLGLLNHTIWDGTHQSKGLFDFL